MLRLCSSKQEASWPASLTLGLSRLAGLFRRSERPLGARPSAAPSVAPAGAGPRPPPQCLGGVLLTLLSVLPASHLSCCGEGFVARTLAALSSAGSDRHWAHEKLGIGGGGSERRVSLWGQRGWHLGQKEPARDRCRQSRKDRRHTLCALCPQGPQVTHGSVFRITHLVRLRDLAACPKAVWQVAWG